MKSIHPERDVKQVPLLAGTKSYPPVDTSIGVSYAFNISIGLSASDKVNINDSARIWKSMAAKFQAKHPEKFD